MAGGEDIDASKPITVEISVEDVRITTKAEYQVVVHVSFFSERTRSRCTSTWSVWRSFSMFRTLDAQLRKRNTNHMKGIKFPPLYRRRTLFRTHLQPTFLEGRRAELDAYMKLVGKSPEAVAFHVTSIESQSLKTFVAYVNGFGQNIVEQPRSADGRTGAGLFQRPKPVVATQSLSANYRWSGTGFLGSNQLKPDANRLGDSFVPINPQQFNQSYIQRQSIAGASAGFVPPPSMRSSTNSIGPLLAALESTRSTESLHKVPEDPNEKLTAVTAPVHINPIVERERGKMELELRSSGLQGVGMPPDGSCFLHCLVFDLFPLKWDCFAEYPSAMTMVNVGSADGMAPRRMAAAAKLRTELSLFAIEHVEVLASFLMTPEDELRQRFQTFGDTIDEQATVAELYAAASMFNLEIILITNDPSFQIDPVLPVAKIPSIRGEDSIRQPITLGYMSPTQDNGGHYISTKTIQYTNNSFAGGFFSNSARNSARNSRASTRNSSSASRHSGMTTSQPNQVSDSDWIMAGCIDCSLLKNELELMKREVNELQMENDKLHEHTSSLSQQVLTLETMNSDLREQLTTPRQELVTDQIQAKQDDEAVEVIQKQLEASLERENVLNEKLRLLEEANATLKESLAHPKIQTVQVIEQVKQDDKTQREELYNALRDNEQLREENTELRAALEKLSKVALEVEAKLNVCEDEKIHLTEVLEEKTLAIERLLHDAETFEAEKQTLEKKILEMDASEARVDTMIMEFKSKFEGERRSLQVQIEQYKTRVQELEVTKANAPSTTTDQNELQQQEEALNDLTSKIAVLQDMRIQDKAAIADLKRKLKHKDADLEQMTDNFVPKDSWKQLDATIHAETKKTEEALKEVGIWKARVTEQRQFIQDLETRCANIEAQLREAEALNAKYEAKAGLTEVMRHQKSLRNDLQAQVTANSQLRVELSRHKDGISKLQAAFSRLKSETGKPDSFEYPDLQLETLIQGNVAIIKELESQLQKLEDERVALLKKLKEQAKMSSAQLFQNHGLTPDQYEQVQTLIYRLQHGDDAPKQFASSMPILQGKEPDLLKLQQTNEFLRSEIDRLTKALQQQSTSDAPPVWAQSVKDEMVKATESLQQHMREHIQVMQSTAQQEEDSFADDSSLHMEDLMAEGDMSLPPPMEPTPEFPEPKLMKNASVHTSGILSPIVTEPIISTEHIAMAVSKALEERFPDHGQKQQPPSNQPIIMDTKEEMEEQTQYVVELDLCLEELTNVTLENQGLRHKLQAMEGMLMSIQDQHTVLYRNHITMEQSFATRRTSLEGQISTLTASIEEAKIKMNRYEMMLKSFESEGEIQQTVVKLTREVAIFEVNQARLAREFNLVKEEKVTEYNRRLSVEDDLMAMEKTLKLQIHYLESWRLGALDRIKQMEMALQKSTLKRFYDGAVTELQHLQAKFAGVMEKLNDRQLHYLATIELPSQHATLLHENAILLAQMQGQPIERVQNDRIQALEVQVKAQLDQIKELETSLQSTTDRIPAPTLATEAVEVYEHRILELEQLCASLEREVQKHKDIAELAATQANTLAIRQTRKRDEIEHMEERLHELSSRTDDDAIIATLQQKIVSIKTNYQSFADRHEAMNKRLEALDEELSNVYAKKRLLERQVEELQSQHDAILNPGIFNMPVDNHLVDRLKHRVQVLEEREKLLVNQVEEAAKISSSMLPTDRLLQEKQALQSQLDATLFEMDKLTHKIQLQLKEISDRDHRIRELILRVENLTMELQQKQVETLIPVSAATFASTPHSPSMKSKVGYYEKDHADLQQAAQATIASLKALVADKNQRVEELQNKLEVVRKEQEKYRQQFHEDMDRQNRRLYEENHLNITKLKEAMEKIQHLEENGGGRAVVAAREMHEGLLEQLKQVH
ncbi:hypothetical protein THRCLA_11505, partial [Thraustotheca clavata]